MPAIKIDTTTLPSHGQRVRWLTPANEPYKTWKQGEYCAVQEMFLDSDPESVTEFDTPWSVVEWEPLP